jgi:hypothetical protein
MERARLLVVFVADTGAELEVADPPGNRVAQRAATSTHTLTALPEHTPAATSTRPILNLTAPTIKGFRVDEGSVRICSQV